MGTKIWFTGKFENVADNHVEELSRLIHGFFGEKGEGVEIYCSPEERTLELNTADIYRYGTKDEEFKSSNVAVSCHAHGITYDLDLYTYEPSRIESIRSRR